MKSMQQHKVVVIALEHNRISISRKEIKERKLTKKNILCEIDLPVVVVDIDLITIRNQCLRL